MANDLPPDYIEFAKQLGFSSPEQWDVTRGNLKDGWKRIHRRIVTGRSLRGTILDFVARMNSSDDHFRRKSGEVGVNRVTPVSAQVQLFEDLYPQFAPYVPPQTSVGSEHRIKKPKAPKVRKPKVKTPMFVQIGFGLVKHLPATENREGQRDSRLTHYTNRKSLKEHNLRARLVAKRITWG